jgi:hypothetical protein
MLMIGARMTHKDKPGSPDQAATLPSQPKQKIVRIRLVITTYNRAENLAKLLADLDASIEHFVMTTATTAEVTADIWNDGGVDVSVPLLSRLKCNYHKEPVNHGKRLYWKLIGRAYKELAGEPYDFLIQLPDDVEIGADFIYQATGQWLAISDPLKISLNLLFDRARAGSPNWTRFTPRIKRFGDKRFFLTGWNDLIFISDARFLKALNHTIHPIAPNRWRKNPRLSSGVGQQISGRLFARSYHMYQVGKSLVSHGSHLSRMNPDRCAQIRLTDWALDEIHCGVASYPGRGAALKQAVASIIDQVDFLHVYLNGYAHIPDFLKQAKIRVYLAQGNLGDLGDAGKFFSAGRISGYFFSIDDDLIYPEGYVWSLIKKIEHYKRRSVVGVHARTMKSVVKSFYRDKARMHHCLHELEKDQVVHILGTGTIAFHTDTIAVRVEQFEAPNMADIWFAILGQQQNVPFVAVSRRRGWLRAAALPRPKDTIYERFARHDQLQTAAFNRISEWKLHSLLPSAKEARPVV